MYLAQSEQILARLAHYRITIVGINYAPESAGIGPYTTALAHSLSEAGAIVHVVTGLPHYPQWAVQDASFSSGSFFRERDGDILVTRCRHWVPSDPHLLGRLRMEASFLARALKVVIRDRSDLIVTVTPSLAGLAAGVLGRRGRPVGAIVQDLTGNAALQTGAASAGVGSAIRAVENGLLRRCAGVGVITTGFRAELLAAGIAAHSLVDLPNFTHIQAATTSTSQAREQLGWDPEKFTVVHTGNMGAKQGLESVLDAARMCERRGVGVDFVLIGDGNRRAALRAAAEGLRSVRILPPVSAADYPTVLAAADVLLVNELPGVRQMSLPSKLTSYAAAGKPVLAAVDPVGITAQFLQSVGLGLVVRAGDPGQVFDAVQALREDPLLLQSLADSSARVCADYYDQKSAYRRYVEFAARVGGLGARSDEDAMEAAV